MARLIRLPKGRHRAAPPRAVARTIRATAVVSMLAGAGLLAVVGWDLWGTGISTARAQSALRAELAEGVAAGPSVPGGALGLIKIPRLTLDAAYVEGVTLKVLAKGPGHFPETPLPGRGGNVAIAGHRTTHGAPFWGLGTLERGDRITLETLAGRFVYRVEWVKVVRPDDRSILRPTLKPSLTLTTCNPWFSARERLVVRAVQVYGRTPEGFIGGKDSPVSPLI
jgi:sortase A